MILSLCQAKSEHMYLRQARLAWSRSVHGCVTHMLQNLDESLVMVWSCKLRYGLLHCQYLMWQSIPRSDLYLIIFIASDSSLGRLFGCWIPFLADAVHWAYQKLMGYQLLHQIHSCFHHWHLAGLHSHGKHLHQLCKGNSMIRLQHPLCT